jgi:hypothetical protein
MRRLAWILTACALTACASDTDVAMKDPRTGETFTCRQSTVMGLSLGMNPWSQTYTCVTDRVAQGWVRAEGQ